MNTQEETKQHLLDYVQRIEPTEPQRSWLKEWLDRYFQTLSEWNLIETASESLRWRIGDLANQLEGHYGESAHTIIEAVHDQLGAEFDLRITLNQIYRCARIARMFPKNYRYRNVPYSVYTIFGELDVGTDDPREKVQRRRLLVEAYSKLREQQMIPVDYHAIRQFAEEYLRDLLAPESYRASPKRFTRTEDGVTPDAPLTCPNPLSPSEIPARAEPIVPNVTMTVLPEPLPVSTPPPETAPVLTPELIETTPTYHARLLLENAHVQLRVELCCTSNRRGFLEIVQRWHKELQDYGYVEAQLDTWRHE